MESYRVDLAIMAMEQQTIKADLVAAQSAFDAYACTLNGGYFVAVGEVRQEIDDLAQSIRMGVKPDSWMGNEARGRVLGKVRALGGRS